MLARGTKPEESMGGARGGVDHQLHGADMVNWNVNIRAPIW
jgi:hypothetical protein